mgnify:CR=1 FL=1
MGIIGFCMGGGFALLTCDRDRCAVASVNYGTVPENVGKSCPVVGSYGARDLRNRGAARKLEAKLDAASVDHDIQEYPSAGHAFLNDSMPGPAALAPLWHVAGFGATERPASTRGGGLRTTSGRTRTLLRECLTVLPRTGHKPSHLRLLVRVRAWTANS